MNKPLYYKLKEDILNDIENKKYKSNDMITSENELCKIYNISRPTVRQAIGELTNMGYLYKIKGKGTFVSDYKNIEIYDHSNGFLFSLIDCNDTQGRNIINVNIINEKDKILNKPVGSYFDLEYAPNLDNEFILTEYTTKYNDKIVYSQSILPVRYFPDVTEKLKNNVSSIDLIGGKYHLDAKYSKSIVYNTIATKNMCDVMHIQKDSVVIVVESEIISRGGTIVEHNISYYNGMNSKIYFFKGRKR